MIPAHPALRLALIVLLLELCGALSLIAGIFSYSQSKVNSNEIGSLNRALNSAAAAQMANAALTQKFVREIEFICTVSAARAAELGLPPPAPDLCSLATP